jgi:glycine/D-amino acid oxidase-like deaminating enzyme
MSEAGMVIVGAGEVGASVAIALRDRGRTDALTLIGEPPRGRNACGHPIWFCITS